ncbi:hypothetical protein LXL04_017938 [Taraxacum kok-saghyz]
MGRDERKWVEYKLLSWVSSKIFLCNDLDQVLKVEKYKPKKFVRPSDKCTCTCGASGMQKQSSNRDTFKSQRSRPSPQLDRNILKRQTCFCCGIAGHIARNCPNPPAVPVHAHHLKNISKGVSPKRKPSRPCCNDSDWNANKAKTRTLPDKIQTHFIKSNLRDSSSKPKSVRSKPSQRPSHSQHSKQKAKSKGRPNSKSSVEAPIRICHGNRFPVLMVMVNPVSKWTGLQKPTNLAPVPEQQRRNIFRPWFVDSGCFMHMRGDISQLLDIQNFYDGYVSFAGEKEKKGKSQIRTVGNGVLKKGVTSFGN